MLTRWLVHQFTRQLAERAMQELSGKGAAAKPENEDPAEITSDCRVAVAFALSEESAGLAERLGGRVIYEPPAAVTCEGTLAGRQVLILETGVGAEQAAARTEQLIGAERPDWIVVAGFAAGLEEHLLRGHLVIPAEIVDTAARTLQPSLELDRETIDRARHLHAGRLLTTAELVRGAARKQQLAEQFGAIACDMESFAVAEVCQRMNTRFLVVRAVSDVLGDPLPEEIDALLNQKSLAGKLGAAVRTLVDRPSVAKDLWQLKQQTQKTSQRLARFLEGVLPQLESA